MRRVTSSELLDHDLGTPAEVACSLDDLWRINRRLGGVSSSLSMIRQVLRRTRSVSVRILDVGAGDGRLAAQLRRDLEQGGTQARFCVLDRLPAHLLHSDPVRAGLLAVAADVFALPFPQHGFDIVMCNLFFHHFSDENATAL